MRIMSRFMDLVPICTNASRINPLEKSQNKKEKPLNTERQEINWFVQCFKPIKGLYYNARETFSLDIYYRRQRSLSEMKDDMSCTTMENDDINRKKKRALMNLKMQKAKSNDILFK